MATLNAPFLHPGVEVVPGRHIPYFMDVVVTFDDHSEGESGHQIIAKSPDGTMFTPLPPVPGSTATLVRGVMENADPNTEYRIAMRSFRLIPGGGYDESPKSVERVFKTPALVWPHLSSGSSGETVRTAQFLLRHHGADIVVDGEFGTQTTNAVEAFNLAHGGGAHFAVTPFTWERLIVQVQLGSQGDAVSAVQSQLASRGMDVVVDGDFGSQTEAAVKTYQVQVWTYEPGADGIVAANVWSALVNGQPLPG